MKHEWGIGKVYALLETCKMGDYFMPVRAFDWSGISKWNYVREYGTMSYEEARAISKLLNAVNQGECK